MSPSLFLRMNEISQIEHWVEDLLAPEQFLVEILVKGNINSQKVLVLIDSDSGLTIDGCAKISRSLGAQLELEELFDGKYTLEVSSPGLDHPLKNFRQYGKNLGRSLKVELNDGNIEEGKLSKVSEEAITINKGKKDFEKSIPFDQINKTMVLVTFNK